MSGRRKGQPYESVVIIEDDELFEAKPEEQEEDINDEQGKGKPDIEEEVEEEEKEEKQQEQEQQMEQEQQDDQEEDANSELNDSGDDAYYKFIKFSKLGLQQSMKKACKIWNHIIDIHRLLSPEKCRYAEGFSRVCFIPYVKEDSDTALTDAIARHILPINYLGNYATIGRKRDLLQVAHCFILVFTNTATNEVCIICMRSLILFGVIVSNGDGEVEEMYLRCFRLLKVGCAQGRFSWAPKPPTATEKWLKNYSQVSESELKITLITPCDPEKSILLSTLMAIDVMLFSKYSRADDIAHVFQKNGSDQTAGSAFAKFLAMPDEYLEAFDINHAFDMHSKYLTPEQRERFNMNKGRKILLPWLDDANYEEFLKNGASANTSPRSSINTHHVLIESSSSSSLKRLRRDDEEDHTANNNNTPVEEYDDVEVPGALDDGNKNNNNYKTLVDGDGEDDDDGDGDDENDNENDKGAIDDQQEGDFNDRARKTMKIMKSDDSISNSQMRPSPSLFYAVDSETSSGGGTNAEISKTNRRIQTQCPCCMKTRHKSRSYCLLYSLYNILSQKQRLPIVSQFGAWWVVNVSNNPEYSDILINAKKICRYLDASTANNELHALYEQHLLNFAIELSNRIGPRKSFEV